MSSRSLDLLEIRVHKITLTLRWYQEPAYGLINLGRMRYSCNLWKISLVFQKYW